MTIKRRVLDVLEDAAEGLCDTCIEKMHGDHSHQTINTACRSLRNEGKLGRTNKGDRHCNSFGKDSILSFLVSSVASLQNSAYFRETKTTVVSVEKLDALRRELIKAMNFLDPESQGLGFSKRVLDLRNREVIPPIIASLMLTHAAYRNAMYYESYCANLHDSHVIAEIDVILRAFIKAN